MIPRSASRTRASTAALIAAVLVALSVAVPLLDRGETAGPVAIGECDGHAGQLAHDHGICLHFGTTSWAPGHGATAPSPILVPMQLRPSEGKGWADLLPAPTHRPRAPPLS